MSKRLDVIRAVEQLIRTALPDAEVISLDEGADVPDRIGPGGRVLIRPGDPGTPQIDLSPVVYNYSHPIPIELAAYGTDTLSPSDVVDAMLVAIATGIEADRFLGGLADYLDASAPETADLFEDGAPLAHQAAADLVVDYSTSHPL